MTSRVQKAAIEVIAERETPSQLKIYLSHPKNLSNANNSSVEYYPRLSWALMLRVVKEPPREEGGEETLVVYPTWGHDRYNKSFGPCGRIGPLTLFAGLVNSGFIELGTYGFRIGQGAEKLTEDDAESDSTLTLKQPATDELVRSVLGALSKEYIQKLYPITAAVRSFTLA